MAVNGSLGRALETRSDTFETLCGSWAGFKLSRYLMQFTGEARYGDWIERLFYNGSGAALPLRPGGRNFYYSDYRIAGGLKVDYWENYTCCSGTYIQDMADYHNLIYYQDASSFVCQPVCAIRGRYAVGRRRAGDGLSRDGDQRAVHRRRGNFALKLRVPEWSRDMCGAGERRALRGDACRPGEWASVERAWKAGDRVEVRIPLHLRYAPVDRWHPRRVALMRGPVVLALDYNYHDPAFLLPADEASCPSGYGRTRLRYFASPVPMAAPSA